MIKAIPFFAACFIILAALTPLPVGAADDIEGFLPPPAPIGIMQPPPAPPWEWDYAMLENRELTRRQEGLDIRNPIPVVTPEFGPGYDYINEHIEEAVAELILEARRVRAREVSFEYEVFVAEDVISIVLFAHTSAFVSRTNVRSVNFMPHGYVLSANDAMGMPVLPLAAHLLAELIRSDPQFYSASGAVDLDTAAFYLTDTDLVFVFDEFALSTWQTGNDTIALHIPNIRATTLHSEQYRVRENGYSLMLIPLRTVATALGFGVSWDAETGTTTLRHGTHVVQILQAGYNIFAPRGQPATALESPPVIINGTTYVPITFFERVLPFSTFALHDDRSVTFLSYSP